MKKSLLFILISISSISLSAQWNNMNLNSSLTLDQCSFPSNDTGYISSGKIYRTFNGGLSFDSVSIPALNNLQCIDFRTNTDGVVCGDLTASGPGIFRTLNAGLTWQNISASNAVGMAMHVKFSDALHGTFLTSAPGLYNTANGGISWDTMTFGYDYFGAIDYPTSSTGYIGGFDGTFNYKGVICKTTNGGLTWNVATNFTQNYSQIQQIQFVNADTGYAVFNPYSQPAHLIRTRNGAVTWDTILFNHGQIVQIAFRNYMNGFIVNDSGSIYRTFDAGVNWTLDRLHTDYLYDINVTSNYAYAVGESGSAIKRDLFSGIPVQQFDTELKIYPNPGADFVNVILPQSTNVISISAMDITGKNCGIIPFAQGNSNELKLDTRSLPKGFYVLQLTCKDKTRNVKFEKSR